MVVLIAFWLVCGIVGAVVGEKKGAAGAGFALGALLGPLGLVIVFVMAGNRRQCPFCRELIDPGATVCPHCQRAVAAVPVATATQREVAPISLALPDGPKR